jgi:hypothetical protein
MATKAESYRAEQQRSGPKKRKTILKARRTRLTDMPRILQSSRTRGQDIRVNHPRRRSA